MYCISGPRQFEVHLNGYKSYTYFPLQTSPYLNIEGNLQFIIFFLSNVYQQQRPHDVHIGLDSNEDDSDIYEIVIGGWGNKLSMIRRGKQGRNLGQGTVDMGSSPGQKGWTEVFIKRL